MNKMKPTIKPAYKITIHRDKTVSFWNVYSSTWERKPCERVSDAELASLTAEDRKKITKTAGK